MTLADKIIAAFIEPFCAVEETARRVLLWVADKAIDRHVTRFARVTAEPEEWDS